MFINNLAFKARELYLTYGIPRVMTVRNRNILRKATRVTKATRKHEVATAGQIGGLTRFDGLRQQEFGGTMDNKQPAFKTARGGSHSSKIKAKNKFRGDLLKPSDIRVRGEKNEAHRIAVFLSRIQREKYKEPFLLMGGSLGKMNPGMLKLGKKAKPFERHRKRLNKRGKKIRRKIKRERLNYGLITLRSFDKKQKRIRRRKWMKPSNDKLLRTIDGKMEWRKAMRYAMKRKKK